MTGFPILMYYLWICLWFYDGKLVYPTSADDIQPFLLRMWEHVRKVSVMQPERTFWLKVNQGRKPKRLRVESLLRQLFLPTVHRLDIAWLSARRPSRSIAGLQNSHVQLQCASMLVRHTHHLGVAPPL